MADYKELENRIDYTFKDRSLLTEALTHSSYSHESMHNKKRNYERLEFLGDAVLSIICAEYLYKLYPEAQEGYLTSKRSSLVCTESLSVFARSINLSDYLILGKGAALSGVEKNATVLENAFEAIIAAIYLDGGMDAAKSFVLPFLENEINNSRQEFKDYKSLFQIIVQKNPDEVFNYKLVREYGPDHDKHYVVELYLNSNVVGTGVGTSKKSAEQDAARQALELMGVEI